MSLGMLAAVLLQTGFIIAFILILLPLRRPTKKALAVMGILLAALATVTSYLAVRCGTAFLMRYGFYLIGVPLFCSIYWLSRAKGIRFLFVAMTAVVFQQMLLTLLVAFRIQQGGFTPLYFLLNVLAFGALLGGGVLLRKDYHKIVFSYHYEFICLTAILLLLFLFGVVFTPITTQDTVDLDLLPVTVALDFLTILLYLYIGVSFHSLGRRVDAEKDALSLRFEMEETNNNLARLRAAQERSFSWHQDRQRYLSTIRELLECGELDKLREYLREVEDSPDEGLPETYCQNEAVNLLLASYSARAKGMGLRLCVDTQLPETLPIDVSELCALLGNVLDNALRAADKSQEAVRLMAKLSDGKLLIQVQNPYTGEVRMVNGLPQSAQDRRSFGVRGLEAITERRGFGIRNVEAIVEKYGGLSSYEAKDGVFTVRFVI